MPPALTVEAFVTSSPDGRASAGDRRGARLLRLPGPLAPISIVDVGTRRLVEVAANVAARPQLLVLDEPAAGLSHEEHIAFGRRLRLVPARSA